MKTENERQSERRAIFFTVFAQTRLSGGLLKHVNAFPSFAISLTSLVTEGGRQIAFCAVCLNDAEPNRFSPQSAVANMAAVTFHFFSFNLSYSIQTLYNISAKMNRI